MEQPKRKEKVGLSGRNSSGSLTAYLMAANELVNLSLDEIISRQNKFKRFGNAQRGRTRGARSGGFSRNNTRGRQIPTIVNAVQRQRYSDRGGQKAKNEKLSIVHVSNLGPMVTTRDLQELFAQHPYVDIAVHYDERGSSRGTAVVLFERFDEAMQLKREFTGVKLDGRLMELYAMSSASTATSSRVFQASSSYTIQKGRIVKPNLVTKSRNFSPKKVVSNDNFGGFRVPKTNRARAVGNRRSQMTADELDRELDAYMHSSKHPPIVAP